MAGRYLETMFTADVLAAQRKAYGAAQEVHGTPERDPLGAAEQEFIATRDSFFLATVNRDGWPYVQHRGGPAGFLTVPSPRELLFADYGGNRQLISVGSLAHDPRVCLFLMDYPARTRLKILGVAEVMDAREHPGLVAASAPVGGHGAAVERVVRVGVQSFDWNCPKFITERYTAEEVEAVVGPLRARVAELEGRLRDGSG